MSVYDAESYGFRFFFLVALLYFIYIEVNYTNNPIFVRGWKASMQVHAFS